MEITHALVGAQDGKARHLSTITPAVAGVRTSRRPRHLDIGSDIEIARCVLADLTRDVGKLVWAEGDIWAYHHSHWIALKEHQLRLAVHLYDGAAVTRTPVKLNKGRIDSILNELKAMCADPPFFGGSAEGINCQSGFICFTADGDPQLMPHSPDHRQRHTLLGSWSAGGSGAPPSGSLLDRLLTGAFKGDGDANAKLSLVGELCAAAASGYATRLRRPSAIVLHGPGAENGKSQVLDIARGVLPPEAVCSIPPAKMGDDRHIVGLAGKLLNATDELSAEHIASDRFKSVVTGEPVDGRDVYKSRVEFRPVAQHVFATNTLPHFSGGLDKGVQRRLIVLTFNRKIPEAERIENIGQRIATEECDDLLAWVVAAAQRLIRQREFTTPSSSKLAVRNWIFASDPVLAWFDECVELREGRENTTRSLYVAFIDWAMAEGYQRFRLPVIGAFVQRVVAGSTGVTYRRTSHARLFVGIALRPEFDRSF
jgi:P4 family phage/plasmid primase-like protien